MRGKIHKEKFRFSLGGLGMGKKRREMVRGWYGMHFEKSGETYCRRNGGVSGRAWLDCKKQTTQMKMWKKNSWIFGK